MSRRTHDGLLLPFAASLVPLAPLGFAALLLFGAPATALAQDREPGSVRFARALSDRGWHDLAGIVLDDLSKDSSTPKAVLEKVKFLRADMAIHEATTAPTAEERKKKIESARAFYENFAKENPDAPQGVEARMRVGEIYLQVGDAAMGRLRDPASTDGEERTKDRAEAQECFTKGAKYFGELKNVYNDLVDKAGVLPDNATAEDNAAAEEKIAEAVYKVSLAALLEAKSLYKHSQTYDAGKEHDELLDKALKQLQQVATEYADVQDTAAEAGMLLGLAEKDQGKLEEAVAAFDGSASVIKTVLPEGKKVTDPYYGDILARALYLRTQALCDKSDWPKALESVKEFLVYFPDGDKKGDQLAQFLKIEEARAKNGSGDQKGALKILDGLLATPATPAVAYNANKTKNDLLGKGGGGGANELSPDKALQAAESMLDGGKKPQGLNRLRQLIAELEVAKTKEGDAMLPGVWYRLARGYFEEDRFDEALVCFDLVVSRYGSDPNAAKAAFYSATCAGRMQGALANDLDKGRQEKALKTLQEKYPKAPETKAGSFLLGNIKLGNKDYVAAAAEYDKVPQDAGEFYEAAIYQSAVVWMLEARGRVAKKDENGAKEAYAKAVTSFQKTITWGDGAAGRGIDPASDRMANVRKVQAESWLRIADIRLTPLMKDPAKALEAAQNSEKALGASGTPERVGEARYYSVQAQLAKADLAAAETALSDLVAVAPDLKRTADAERDVAAALDQKLQDLRKDPKSPKAEVESVMARAADHYSRWLAISQKNQFPISMLQASRAGDRLFLLAILINGLPEGTFGYTEVEDLKTLPAVNRFEQAAKAFEFAARQIPPVDPKAPPKKPEPPKPGKPGAPEDNEPWLILVKLGQCMGFLQRFDACVAAIDRALEMERLVDDKGNIVTAVAKVRTPLLYAFADSAQAARLQGDKTKDKAFYERAISGFQKLIVVCPADGDLWWRSKYEFIYSLGQKGDYVSAGVGVRSLQRQYPEYDGNRFKYKARFEALAADIEKKAPPDKKP